MTSRRSRRIVGPLSAFAALVLLTGCGPIPVGLTAVSQRDGQLLIGVMRCDDTALKHAAVTHRGPFQSDAPRAIIDDARWTTDQDDDDVVVLDTSKPDEAWETEMPLSELEPAVPYSASAGGGSDHPMGSVSFTRDELKALAEGQWLYTSGDEGQDNAVRPTTTDLGELREKECDS